MSRKKKLVNHSFLPDHAVVAFARCILPDILEFYGSEEGREEFLRWKAKKAAEAECPDRKNA